MGKDGSCALYAGYAQLHQGGDQVESLKGRTLE